MGKIEGIRTIQRLAKGHPEVIQAHLHPVVLALLTEVKNLRSSVARAAILAVGDLFVSLKKNIEPVSLANLHLCILHNEDFLLTCSKYEIISIYSKIYLESYGNVLDRRLWNMQHSCVTSSVSSESGNCNLLYLPYPLSYFLSCKLQSERKSTTKNNSYTLYTWCFNED